MFQTQKVYHNTYTKYEKSSARKKIIEFSKLLQCNLISSGLEMRLKYHAVDRKSHI